MELQEERGFIHIGGNNICIVCGGDFKFMRCYRRRLGEELPSVKFVMSHPRCQFVKDNIKKLKAKLLDKEFELFLLKFNDKS